MSECYVQAFINTAKEIYQKIQDGVFDVNNEVSCHFSCLLWNDGAMFESSDSVRRSCFDSV